MTSCIEHTQYGDQPKYGVKWYAGKNMRWHRWVMLMHHVPIGGLVVRHTCHNPRCINPDHLTVGTQADNMNDAVRHGTHNEARKTHCKWGHELTPGSYYVTPQGDRSCRACRRRRQREYIERQL